MPSTVKTIRYATHALLSFLLVLTLLALDFHPVAACTCAGDLPFIEYVVFADAIFSGTVVDQKEALATDQNSPYATLSTIEVARMWKGRQSQKLIITVEHTGCGYSFEMGKAYLIFAYAMNGQLNTGSCSRTQLLETAEEDIFLLDNLFSVSSNISLHLPTTITVDGKSTYITETDQISIRFVVDTERARETTADMGVEIDLEKQREQLMATLHTSGITPAILTSAPLYSDGKDFYLTIKRDLLQQYTPGAFLQQITKIQRSLAGDSQIAIGKIEVMFTLADCTMTLANAQRGALRDAQGRATLLSTLMGGSLDGVVAIEDMTVDQSLQTGFGVCGAMNTRQWHTLPLTTNLSSVLYVEVPITLHVTFAVRPALISDAPTSSPSERAPATATPASFSPLPAP